jgi:hypothetical protein
MFALTEEEAQSVFELPTERDIPTCQSLAHEVEDWLVVGSYRTRNGKTDYTFDNLGHVTLYNEQLGVRRQPTSMERDIIKDLDLSEYV